MLPTSDASTDSPAAATAPAAAAPAAAVPAAAAAAVPVSMSVPALTPDHAELVIESGRAERQYWADLVRYRELFYFLAWRDVLVRYKQTVIGLAWALLRPILTTLVFTLVFGKLARLPAEGSVPYPLMVFAAMLAWQLFATALNDGSNSLVGNANLISKVYFPRLIVPASALIVALVDFVVTLGLLGLLLAVYRYWPGWTILGLVPLTGLAVAAALGPTVLLSALNVEYRDFRYVIPFVVQFGLYVSPVGFSSARVPAGWRLVYGLNPMVGVIDGFRWAVGGASVSFPWVSLAESVAVSAGLLWAGVWYFRRTERTFADVI